MEYLFFSSGSLSDNQAITLFNTKRIGGQRTDAVQSVGAHGLVTNGRLEKENSHLFALFGTAFVGNQFFSNFAPRSAGDTVRACREIMADPQNATGSFTGIVADTNSGDTQFLLDDLNSALCFTARHKQKFAVSSNIHMLADWLVSQGVTPTRSIEPYLSYAVFLSGLTSADLYQEIKVIQPEERPAIINGRLVLEHNDPVWPKLTSASYDDLIAAACSRIRHRMRVLTESQNSVFRMFDLTGGMDSRMILAALVNEDLLNSWHFHNYFDSTNPDSNFAQLVGENYGIRQARTLENKGPHLEPGTIQRLNLFHSMGSNLRGGQQPHLYQPTVIQANGGSGELGGKSQDNDWFRPRQGDLNDVNDHVELYLTFIRQQTGGLGFSSKILDWGRPKVRYQIETSMAELDDLNQMPAVFYRRNKARSHFGVGMNFRAVRSQVANVLCDPYLTAAAVKIGNRQSHLGRVNFDVIRMLGGSEIAGLPLVDTRWHRDLFESDHDFNAISKPPISSESENLFKGTVVAVDQPEYQVEPLRDELWGRDSFDIMYKESEAKFSHLKPGKPKDILPLADLLLKHAPTSPEVSEYLPDATIRQIVSNAADGKFDGRTWFKLMFFCQSEMWLRELEISPFPA